jgi:cell division protein FtsN
MAARRRRPAGRSATPSFALWALLVIALAGLAIGAMIYLRSAEPEAPPQRLPPAAPPAKRPPASPMPKSGRFEFYEMLPKSEVVVPDTSDEGRPDATPTPLGTPGVYVLQAGAYATFAEADRIKAELALLGITSQIQRIAVEDRQYHRVRIGPIENLDELNRLRQRLREAKIDAMLIRVGE